MKDPIDGDREGDGAATDRRGFLKCMAWAGTGLVWTAGGGLLSSRAFGQDDGRAGAGSFSFVQISDSHIGFGKTPYRQTVAATLQEAVDRINALKSRPDFLIHTGDLTHLSTPREFDTVSEILKGAKVSQIYYVPGEHDLIGDGSEYRDRFGKGTGGRAGTASISRGRTSSAWSTSRARGRTRVSAFSATSSSTGSRPTWRAWPPAPPSWSSATSRSGRSIRSWGWGTQDGARRRRLRRFGSVTVLNGHIHQTLQKVEGKMTFHTACSTGFPQPAPGAAPAPGPLKNVPAEKLRAMLGLTSVNFVAGRGARAVVDTPLG